MAKRRTYKRDKRGRFARTNTARIKHTGRKIASASRRAQRVSRHPAAQLARSSVTYTHPETHTRVGKHGLVGVGRVGPGGAYAGFRAGAVYGTRKRSEYYVGVSASKRIGY
jgi:hypothetical protein